MSRREPRLSSLRLEAEGVLGAGAKKSVKQRWKNPQGFSQVALIGSKPPHPSGHTLYYSFFGRGRGKRLVRSPGKNPKVAA
jgi:hypothetical protein